LIIGCQLIYVAARHFLTWASRTLSIAFFRKLAEARQQAIKLIKTTEADVQATAALAIGADLDGGT
jgi:hypothetical protein